jgi:uncharacterized membrane protein
METTAPLEDDRSRARKPALWVWPAALLVMALAAFFPTYFGRFPRFEGTSVSLHFHVTTMLLWVGLTLIQPMLVTRRQLVWHRRLGRLAYVLLPVITLGFRVKRLEMRPYGLALGAFLVALVALTLVMVAFPAAPERLWSLLFT